MAILDESLVAKATQAEDALSVLSEVADRRFKEVKAEREANEARRAKIRKGAALAILQVDDSDESLAKEAGLLASILDGGSSGDPANTGSSGNAPADPASARVRTTPTAPASGDASTRTTARQPAVKGATRQPAPASTNRYNWWKPFFGILLAFVGLVLAHHTSHGLIYNVAGLRTGAANFTSKVYTLGLMVVGFVLGFHLGVRCQSWIKGTPRSS